VGVLGHFSKKAFQHAPEIKKPLRWPPPLDFPKNKKYLQKSKNG